MSPNEKYITVLTGDIVGSTQLTSGELENAIQALRQRSEELTTWHNDVVKFSRFRGDGWQVAIQKPEFALRTALSLRSALRSLGKKFSTRIACVTDIAHLPLKDNLNSEVQAPFVKSGRLLEELTTKGPLVFMRSGDDAAQQAVFLMAEYISEDWTPPQSDVMRFALLPYNYAPSLTQIGKELGKSRQAVTKAYLGAGGDALQWRSRTLGEGTKK